MDMTSTTYQPDNSIRKGYVSVFGEIVREVRKNKWLMYQLFKRDFFAAYKQSLVGILWAFVVPFVSVGTFILLNRSGIFSIGDVAVPYPIFAILGMAFWQLFSTGLIAGSSSLIAAGPMITKINFSKKSLVIASIARSAIPFLIQFLVVIVLFFSYGTTPSVAILLAPILAIPILFMTVGLSFLFSLFNSVVRDIGNALSFIITFLMFLTPVLYVKPEAGVLATITKYNPLYYLVSSIRDFVLSGTFLEWRGFVFSSIFSLIVFVLCLLIFHLTETRVAERI